MKHMMRKKSRDESWSSQQLPNELANEHPNENAELFSSEEGKHKLNTDMNISSNPMIIMNCSIRSINEDKPLQLAYEKRFNTSYGIPETKNHMRSTKIK
mmetsp:Transcript_7348/g.6509  ORF Transcript_7348/g.6509 Transcript_7348/m.6509 type:complete len:99 (+) Transcript_7348:165-461(+)